MKREAEENATSWVTPIIKALDGGVAALFGVERAQGWSWETLEASLGSQGYTCTSLPPPLPWAPFAPLHQLCRRWEKPWPTLERVDLPALWLGIPVLQSSLYIHIAAALQGCPTIAWIDAADLEQPLWKHFLQAVQQGELAMPVVFLCRLDASHPTPPGLQLLVPKPLTQSTTSPQTRPLPKRTANYLSQALLWGPRLNRKAMKAVSRADHRKHTAAMRKAGLLDSQDRFVMERLRSAHLGVLPHSQRWRRKALAQLAGKVQAHHELTKTWLRFGASPALTTGPALTEQTCVQATLQLGPAFVEAVQFSDAQASSSAAQCVAALAALQTPGALRHAPETLTLTAPYDRLFASRALPLQGMAGCHALKAQHDALVASGPGWAAALAALDLARWHQALGQEQQTFALLNPHKDEPHWAIQWQRWLLLAETYRRMGRLDMARHALSQAVEVAPTPLSPVLAGELRLFTAQMQGGVGDSPAAQTQHNAARDTFRGMGDGRRLGRQLCLRAADLERRNQLDDARTLYAQALNISRRYGDGIGATEAEFKLGLLRKRAAQREN